MLGSWNTWKAESACFKNMKTVLSIISINRVACRHFYYFFCLFAVTAIEFLLNKIWVNIFTYNFSAFATIFQFFFSLTYVYFVLMENRVLKNLNGFFHIFCLNVNFTPKVPPEQPRVRVESVLIQVRAQAEKVKKLVKKLPSVLSLLNNCTG